MRTTQSLSELYHSIPSIGVVARRSSLFLICSLTVLGCKDSSRPENSYPEEVVPTTPDQEVSGGDECIPDCDQRTCGVDPRCGTSCGTCSDDEICEAAQCVSSAPIGGENSGGQTAPQAGDEGCTATCESEGAVCGSVCGTSCGDCPTGERCEEGQCSCTPQCAGLACGDPDGCGGVCEPCPRTESCQDCALRLTVESFDEVGGAVRSARVKLSLNLPEGVPHPEIADLQLEIMGPAVLGRVGLGTAVIGAEKQLVPDPATGMPYRVNGQRYNFMLLSTQNTREIPSGDWLFFDIMIGDTRSEPVQIRVVQREQTFAPPAADLQLWGGSLGDGLVIWPALGQGE